jgi:hypothetical protein
MSLRGPSGAADRRAAREARAETASGELLCSRACRLDAQVLKYVNGASAFPARVPARYTRPAAAASPGTPPGQRGGCCTHCLPVALSIIQSHSEAGAPPAPSAESGRWARGQPAPAGASGELVDKGLYRCIDARCTVSRKPRPERGASPNAVKPMSPAHATFHVESEGVSRRPQRFGSGARLAGEGSSTLCSPPIGSQRIPPAAREADVLLFVMPTTAHVCRRDAGPGGTSAARRAMRSLVLTGRADSLIYKDVYLSGPRLRPPSTAGGAGAGLFGCAVTERRCRARPPRRPWRRGQTLKTTAPTK